MNKEKLKEVMDKRKVNMSDLADMAGVNKAIISRTLPGPHNSTVNSAAKIRRALKLSQRDTISIFLEE